MIEETRKRQKILAQGMRNRQAGQRQEAEGRKAAEGGGGHSRQISSPKKPYYFLSFLLRGRSRTRLLSLARDKKDKSPVFANISTFHYELFSKATKERIFKLQRGVFMIHSAEASQIYHWTCKTAHGNPRSNN